MENNEQHNQEALQTEAPANNSPKTKANKRTARKTTGKTKGEEAKKTATKARSIKARKEPTATEVEVPVENGNENNNNNASVTQATETVVTDNKQETTTINEPSTPQEPIRQTLSVPSLPNIRINNIIDLLQAPMRSIVLTDQQIQQLTLEEIEVRHRFLEETLARVLDYDVVISDTNIWLELLIGYTSSHSDPRYNARLQFERQLEFISKLTYYRSGRFIILGETYEEIDRFASMLDPANHRDADFTDNIVCLNTAARLAKRLILAQQRENRLRIDGIGAESHHAAFADPAIIRKVAELFANGKKVLLLTNDASVAIRAIGICDDLQRYNNIPDEEWDKSYAPLRPMVFTFDDLKQLDFYTKQYHYIQMAAGVPWMSDIERKITRNRPEPLELNLEAFKPGDKHRADNLFNEQEKTQGQQKLLQQKKQLELQKKQEQAQKLQQAQPQKKAQPKPQPQVALKPVQPDSVAQQQTTNNNSTTNDVKQNVAEVKAKPRPKRKPQRKKTATDQNVDKTQTSANISESNIPSGK